MATDGFEQLFDRLCALLDARRFADIERALRDALPRFRDDPHVNLLLAIACLHSNWDASATYGLRALQLAPGDRDVADRVAAVGALRADPSSIERAAEMLVLRRAGAPRTKPPAGWPRDLERELFDALKDDPGVHAAAVDALTVLLESDPHPGVDFFVEQIEDDDARESLRELRRDLLDEEGVEPDS